MRARLKKAVVLFMVFAMYLQMLPIQPLAVSDTSDVGALLDVYQTNQEFFCLTADSRLFVISDVEPSGELLQTVQLIQQQFAAASQPSGEPMELVWGPENWVREGDVVITLDAGSYIDEEGYRLEVTQFARITAADVDGLLYGANMLLKRFRTTDSSTIQGFTAEDTPDTVQRAVSLDCGRKYYTKDWICNFIREMSWMGYNTLELHFSDDSGFRIDIWDENFYTENYHPQNDFSWICGSNYTSWTLSAYQNDPDKGRYLNAEELIEILRTAKEYHIDIIPAFDSPSHLDYLTWKYEQNYKGNPQYSFYSSYDEKQYFASDVKGIINYTKSSGWSTPLKWPYYSTMNVVDAQAKAFIFELYIDIADFFSTYSDSEDFSIGADEVNLSTGNLASGYRYAWGFSDFVDYINELNTLLNDKGYTMRMYNDFMGSTAYGAANYDFADNIEILYWDSPFEPNSGGAGTKTEPVRYYVDNGRTLFNCIQTNTYYALRITGDGSDARSIRNRQWTFYHSNEEDIYNEWYPADISEHGDYAEDTEDVPTENLGGAYFLIWGDYACVSTEVEIWNGCYDATSKNTGEFYSLRDRMWSNAIKMWNWDVNESVPFSEYAAIRDSYGDFPGCGSGTNACSEKTILPSATDITSGYASSCEAYPSYCRIQIQAETFVMSLPCDSSLEESALVVENAGCGAHYDAIKLLKNTIGEFWYKVRCEDGTIGYIKSEDTEYVCELTDDILLTDAVLPSGHIQGQSFSVTGTIQSRYNELTSVAVSVYSGYGRDGAEVTGGSDMVVRNTYTLTNSAMNEQTAFHTIPLGEHTYVIAAEYRSFYTQADQVVETGQQIVLAEKCFCVVASAVDQDTCDHSYTATVYREPTCKTEGLTVYSCSSCGYVYEETTAKAEHTFEQQKIAATCQNYEKIQYSCIRCGYSYEDYADGVMSPWQTEIPEGVDEALIESKEVYRYSDYETLISEAPSLEGYEVLQSTWEKVTSDSVEYVHTWPAGFSKEHDLYQQYNRKDEKTSAFEENGKKRVIDSDQVSGYLYYHWCYSGSYYSMATQSGSYRTFHAYFSTEAPGNFTCDYSDMSYKTGHSVCSNSQWFFVTSVYTQSYTDYTKQYTHGKWTPWSEWVEEPVTASDNHKVEKQTMYRYVRGALGDHSWREGECTLCGISCDHAYQNNICPFCGTSKPLMDYYLFGYISGNNYGCEEDFEKIGEYRFENGQLVVYFTQDSYVAVKSEDNQHWYMTAGWQDFASSAKLYNTKDIVDATPDKLYIPGNKRVTLTLTDCGDDTYILSYVTDDCSHDKHSQTGVCNLCGSVVEHSYQDGYCVCGLVCAHHILDGYCTICGAECDHIYRDNVCAVCGTSKPVMDYYLFGYINGANYGCEEDFENLGDYQFVDGHLTVYFKQDSYVGVKSEDNQHWYMTAGWQDFVSSVTLYNTKNITDTTADKLYVPGNTQIDFSLQDNGDDTYVLSYTVSQCLHKNHNEEGECLICGAQMEHVYEDGYCSCGRACVHSFENSLCSICGAPCTHAYRDFVCLHCGAVKPQMDYYLFGYINGQDYACEADSSNLGEYLFEDGVLTAYFTQDSYVGVKSSDNLNWYMTDGWQDNASSVMLYNSETLSTADKLYVPGNMVISFVLTDHGDDTYTLCYTASECVHERHTQEGACMLCGKNVSHSFCDGVCACGLTCTHRFVDGICAVCGQICSHSWEAGQCSVCYVFCDHIWSEGLCSTCGKACMHGWQEGCCTTCGYICAHDWEYGVCLICTLSCHHKYQNNVCQQCGYAKPAVEYYLFGVINGVNYAFEEDAHNLGEYHFVGGKLVTVFQQESFVAVRADDHKGWYMTDGAQGNTTSCLLYNTAAISNGQLLRVPGQMVLTFSLQDNGDDTLTLHYSAEPCLHEKHDKVGDCIQCSANVGHRYETVVTPPTCTENGYTVYSCSCGTQYTADEVSAVGHHYDNGTCTLCGEPKPIEQPTIMLKYPTLSFEDEIRMNVYFSADPLDDVTQFGLITYSEEVGSWDITSAECVTDEYYLDEVSGLYIAETQGIAAKCLGDVIYFSVYAQLSDGTYLYSDLIGYSPATYAYNLLMNSNSTTSMKALIVAMLNYGAAAQEYFGYRTDTLVNSSLTEEMQSLVRQYDADMVMPIVKADISKIGSFTSTTSGFVKKYPTISFEGAFCINYYLEPQAQPEGEMLLYVWDHTVYAESDVLSEDNAVAILKLSADEQGSYHASVERIAAKALDQTIFAAAVYSDGEQQYCSGVMSYHIGSYCASQAKAPTDMQELAAWTAVYGYYAKTYFAQ